MRTPTRLIATLILLFISLFEIRHDLLSGEAWPGFTMFSNNVVFLLVSIWIFGMVSFWFDAEWAFYGKVASIASSLVHGLIIFTGNPAISEGAALIYMLSAPVLGLMLWLLERTPKYVDHAREKSRIEIGRASCRGRG